jgi:hypothetical protein
MPLTPGVTGNEPFHLAARRGEMDRQAIHMDQGLAWCPEFRATRSMSDYPSRKAELVRAIHLGQVPPSERAAEILFHSILSFQGERWQVFGEPPADWTALVILGRQALLKAGFGAGPAEETRRRMREDQGSLEVPTVPGGTDWLHVDSTCAAVAAPGADRLAALLQRAGIRLGWEVRPSIGLWELFVYGAVEEGAARARALVAELRAMGVRRVVAMEGREVWLWRSFLPEIGVSHPFEVVDVVEAAGRLETEQRTFLYAGSFRARALNQSGMVNRLIEPGQRANAVTIWQRPICAEHELVGFPSETERMILEDALEEIHASGCSRIVLFDAHAYRALRKGGTPREVSYFTDMLA